MREVKLAVVPFVLLLSSQARAGECLAEYEHAQLARKAGKLVESRDALRVCASSTCPKVTRDDCAPWLKEVEAALPSIVVSGRCGGTPQDGTVTVDQHALGDGVVDAGSHAVVLRTPYGTASKTVDVAAGQKSQPVVIDLPVDACPPATKQPSSKRSLLPFALGAAGVGVVAFGFWTGFGVAGISDRQGLIHSCYPHCLPSQVDEVKGLFTAADVSMVIGIVALAAAGAILVWDWTRASPHTTAASRPMTIAF
jgi:hypothetical protein